MENNIQSIASAALPARKSALKMAIQDVRSAAKTKARKAASAARSLAVTASASGTVPARSGRTARVRQLAARMLAAAGVRL
jgi:hypothetical protein